MQNYLWAFCKFSHTGKGNENLHAIEGMLCVEKTETPDTTSKELALQVITKKRKLG